LALVGAGAGVADGVVVDAMLGERRLRSRRVSLGSRRAAGH
jgi:hypothetical protein